GMASTFITRLRVGSKLIDAKGVSLLYRQRISSLQLSVLIIAGLVALGVALFATAAGQTLIGLIGAQLDGVFGWFGSLFGGEPAAPSESASIIQGLTSD
ncbi:MAG: SteA C-terminal domain-containing protein, partial [Brevibacterium sp.]|nr:SteA C-terminal domain-containing protein [Brevibacterium sp.]